LVGKKVGRCKQNFRGIGRMDDNADSGDLDCCGCTTVSSGKDDDDDDDNDDDDVTCCSGCGFFFIEIISL
jgi:hypothetical protein